MRRIAIGIITAAVTCFSGAAVPAQQQPVIQSHFPQTSTRNDPRGDIDFPGGTVAEYVAAIEKVFGSANAAVGPGAAEVQVAPVKLTQVRREDALWVLEAIDDTGSPDKWITVSVKGSPPIVCLSLDVRENRKLAEVRVWSLQRLASGGVRTEDVLSAIETAVGLVPGEPQIKFHRDTNLLIMRAPIEQLDAANQVLHAIQSALADRQAAAAREQTESPKPAAEVKNRVP